MSDQLYIDMAKHPDIAPVLGLLELADGSDPFSRALMLARNCFSPDSTLRALSRLALRRVMEYRIELVTAYEAAVVTAARDYGDPKDFGEALQIAPREVVDRIHADFVEQIRRLKL